jgi:DNA-binding CsgD family transcriptional regulator
MLIIVYLFSAFVGFESAITVYRLNRLSKLNRIFSAYAGTFTIYSIIMIQFFLSPDEETCFFWHRIFAVLACIFMAVGVRFFLELAGARSLTRNRIFLAVFYSLPALFALPSVTFWPILAGVVRVPWGWTIVLKESIWTLVYFSYIIGSNIACTTLALYWRITAATWREKKQAQIIMLSNLVGTIGLIHLFFPAAYPQATQALIIHFYYISCFMVLVFGVRFAIKKYGLMTLIPENTASELFDGMREALFVTDTAGSIVFMNKNARTLARHSGKSAAKVSIFDLFASGKVLKYEIDELKHGRESRRSVILTASGKAGGVALEASLLDVKNEVGKLIGFLVILREAGGIQTLQERHGLSPREMEVLLLLSCGMSAQEIARECEIALLTAKTHIHNIYQKTGLKNRVELSNLLNKHL